MLFRSRRPAHIHASSSATFFFLYLRCFPFPYAFSRRGRTQVFLSLCFFFHCLSTTYKIPCSLFFSFFFPVELEATSLFCVSLRTIEITLHVHCFLRFFLPLIVVFFFFPFWHLFLSLLALLCSSSQFLCVVSFAYSSSVFFFCFPLKKKKQPRKKLVCVLFCRAERIDRQTQTYRFPRPSTRRGKKKKQEARLVSSRRSSSLFFFFLRLLSTEQFWSF